MVAFADEVVAAGHTVVMPHLFGEVGGDGSVTEVAKMFPKLCVNKEFTKMALGETTPVAGWLRSLARELHAELGGPGRRGARACASPAATRWR